MASKQKVDDIIRDNIVAMFSKSYCPYCKMAKSALEEVGCKYFVIELDREADGDAMQDYLHQMTGARTVPRVFIKGKCIGGGTETKNLMQSGELKKMLTDAGGL